MNLSMNKMTTSTFFLWNWYQVAIFASGGIMKNIIIAFK